MDRPLIVAEKPQETAFLVGVQITRSKDWNVEDSMEELSLLCETAGARVLDRLICKVARPVPATFVGKGKALEIAELAKQWNVTTVIFDDDLSPAQGRNLEKMIGVKVIDRTQLILDIFAQHARTSEGRMQIELAQLEYLLPRLKRMWTHLERQKGGIGLRGPGEQQIELDRRRILERIVRFRRELEHVRDHRSEQRRGRRRQGWALISLVGYTNAGKSTLLNRLTGADVLAGDKLFATLDPTTRQLKLPNHQAALVTDTVGFIRKLPHDLVEAFKATLEEVIEADLLVHVIDASHPQVEEQIKAVEKVLRELGVHDKQILAVFNKMDMPETHMTQVRLAEGFEHSVSVSALTGEGIEHFKDVLADCLRNRNIKLHMRIPLREGKLLSTIHSVGKILKEEYDGDHANIEAYLPTRFQGLCERYLVDKSSKG